MFIVYCWCITYTYTYIYIISMELIIFLKLVYFSINIGIYLNFIKSLPIYIIILNTNFVNIKI